MAFQSYGFPMLIKYDFYHVIHVYLIHSIILFVVFLIKLLCIFHLWALFFFSITFGYSIGIIYELATTNFSQTAYFSDF
jgi:uncharacterized membrane protein